MTFIRLVSKPEQSSGSSSERNSRTAFELGKNLFGRYASEDGDRSMRYKQAVKDKLRAKSTEL